MKSIKLIEKKTAHCMFEFVYFANPASTIDSKNIYRVRLRLGKELAKQLKDIKADYIVPVPDTSRSAAQAISEELGLPVREAIIKNRYMHRTFIMSGEGKRKKTAKQKYHFLRQLIRGKRLIVVDDSIVRGLTSQHIISQLREAGASEIHLAITCPPLRHPCFYGIDFPSVNELIAAKRRVKEVSEFLQVDSLTYLSNHGLRTAIGIDDLCDACISGHYPTKNGTRLRATLGESTTDQTEKAMTQFNSNPNSEPPEENNGKEIAEQFAGCD